MATYVEINGAKHTAVITGRINDKDWDNRASKAVRVTMNYNDAAALFVDDVQWNIVQEIETIKEVEDNEGNVTTETVMELEVYDNSEYCIAGDITDHRDGTVTVKMGKPTAEELLTMLEEVL